MMVHSSSCLAVGSCRRISTQNVNVHAGTKALTGPARNSGAQSHITLTVTRYVVRRASAIAGGLDMFNEFELLVIGVGICYAGLALIEWLSVTKEPDDFHHYSGSGEEA
jgi:hypothetical protein